MKLSLIRLLGPFLLLFFAASVSSQQARTITVVAPKELGGGVLYDNSFAVLIGINEYARKGEIPTLDYGENDAEAMALLLADRGFPRENIVILRGKEATKEKIEEAIYDRFRARMTKESRLLIFFAGHGETVKWHSGVEEGFLLPHDADPSRLDRTALSMSDVTRIGQRIPAKHVLFAVDACYSGFAVRSRILTKPAPRELQLWTGTRAVQVLTAGRKGQQSLEKPEYRHGVFTYHLLNGLKGFADLDRDGIVSFSELSTYLKKQVSSEAPQDPQASNLFGEGEFIFVLPPEGPPDRIVELLALADGLIARQALTTPPGGNAFEVLQEVLRLNPRHPGALERLRGIAHTYKAWARKDLERGQLERARRYLDAAKRILPEDRELAELEDRLANVEDGVLVEGRIRRLFDQNRFEDALVYVERAKDRTFLSLLEGRKTVGLPSRAPLGDKEIRKLVPQGSALLEYYMSPDETYAFVVLPDRIHGVRLPTPSQEIARRVLSFRGQAVEKINLEKLQSTAYKKVLMELYADLISPVESRLVGVRHLTFVPHGILHYMPFQALLQGESYLIERFSISYAPSASILALAKAKVRVGRKRSRLLAVGNPKTDLEPLPASEVEVHEVSKVFGKQQAVILLGPQATETRVKTLLPSFDVIHLATHGELLANSPLDSNLRFTPSGNDDGKLTVSEIFSLNLQADLVVLSACETAVVAGHESGGELQGLSRAFITAGSPSVVATLWKVSDESTARLMGEFFKHLTNRGKAEALRTAMVNSLHREVRLTAERGVGGTVSETGRILSANLPGEHPYFWSAFVLAGDWN